MFGITLLYAHIKSVVFFFKYLNLKSIFSAVEVFRYRIRLGKIFASSTFHDRTVNDGDSYACARRRGGNNNFEKKTS